MSSTLNDQGTQAAAGHTHNGREADGQHCYESHGISIRVALK